MKNRIQFGFFAVSTILYAKNRIHFSARVSCGGRNSGITVSEQTLTYAAYAVDGGKLDEFTLTR